MPHAGDNHPELNYLDKMDLPPEVIARIKGARIEAGEITDRLGSIWIDGWPTLLKFLEDALEQARQNERASRSNYRRKEFTDFPDVPVERREETIRQLPRSTELWSYLRFKIAVVWFFIDDVILHPTKQSALSIDDGSRTITLELW